MDSIGPDDQVRTNPIDEELRALARAELIEQIVSLEGLDLDDPEVMRQAWRSLGPSPARAN
jgi:hypothetical protein